MRKTTLSLFALLLCITAYCGVPQSFSYQAVALGPTGAPIQYKNIALRLSILAGSPTGTISYQERQTATTSGSGIVSVQIGNGAVLSGSFTTIDWSQGLYYLKTEIDTNAGTNYQTVGTVQFFSVPYAMYSGSAGQANLASSDFPDGLNAITPIRLDGTFTYIVPVGTTLYINSITSNGSTSCTDFGALVDGIYISSTQPPAVTAGSQTGPGSGTTTISDRYIANNPITVPESKAITSISCGTSLTGFTIAKNYSWVLFDLSTGNYTVPNNKVLVIKNMIYNSASAWNHEYTVGTLTTTFNGTAAMVDQGQTISATGLSNSVLMMGFLKNR